MPVHLDAIHLVLLDISVATILVSTPILAMSIVIAITVRSAEKASAKKPRFQIALIPQTIHKAVGVTSPVPSPLPLSGGCSY
jgi:hypothetical protein